MGLVGVLGVGRGGAGGGPGCDVVVGRKKVHSRHTELCQDLSTVLATTVVAKPP